MEIKWCSSCLVMSTRPRVAFDPAGRCNACVWTDSKKTVDWEARSAELERLLDKHRKSDGSPDCVVPVSGGKDGTYVYHQLKEKWGMNPLVVTIQPALPLSIGRTNLDNFIDRGANHLLLSPSSRAMKRLNKTGFVEMGFPYYGWLISISVSVINIAHRFDCGLVFYGEDGEVEYGGSTETERGPNFGLEYLKRVYFESGHEMVLTSSGLDESELHFFRFLPEIESGATTLDLTHWSYFENWDPYRNYLLAKELYGLQEADSSNAGTFTNFAQNDQALYALHTYLMYLKFGFGRANQDASIEIRRGAMTRQQGVELVRLYDGQYPSELEELYLDYYDMTREEFRQVLAKWTNKDLFDIEGKQIVPKFMVK